MEENFALRRTHNAICWRNHGQQTVITLSLAPYATKNDFGFPKASLASTPFRGDLAILKAWGRFYPSDMRGWG